MPDLPDPLSEFFGITPPPGLESPRRPRRLINELITIPGHPYVKKNTSVKYGVRTKGYTRWANRAGVEIGKYGHVIPVDYPVNLQCRFFLEADYTVDLSNLYEGVQDVLKSAGVILDDNYKIITSHNGSGVAVDRANPRTEIFITKR